MLILKQNAANTVPTPPAGKGTIFLDDSDVLSVKTSDGNVENFPTVAASNSQVVFMNGTALSGEAAFTYDFNNNILTVSGNIAAGNVKTDNLLYANGVPYDFQQTGGSNTQIQFNDADSFGGSAAFTFNKSSNLVTVSANLDANNLNATSFVTAGNVYANSGTVGAANLSVTSTAVIGTANVTNLNATGNAVIGGNLTVNGNVTYVNVETLDVEDPIIQLGGGPNGAPLTSDDGKDRGSALNYFSGTAKTAFMGYDNSNSEFGMGSVVTITNDVVTFSTYGNLRVGNIIGNGQALTGINGANVTGTVANATHAATSNTVVDAAQPNITSVGTLSSLSVTGNINSNNIVASTYVTAASIYANSGSIGAQFVEASLDLNAQRNVGAGNVYANSGTVGAVTGSFTGNVSAGNIKTDNLLYANGNPWDLSDPGGANTEIQFNDSESFGGSAAFTFNKTSNLVTVSANLNANNLNATTHITAGNVYANLGTIGGALLTGTLTTAAQPNITSVGTLTSLSVSGNIIGGNLIAPVANGNSSLDIPAANGNINLSVAGNANILVVTGTGVNVAGTLNASANANLANVGAGAGVFTANVTAGNVYANSGTVGASLLTGTLTTASQPNVTALGTLGSLGVSGNISAGGLLTNNLYYANGNPWDLSDPGGANTEIQFNDDESFGGSSAFTFNKSSNLVTVSANLNANNLNATSFVTAGNVYANSGTIGAALLTGTLTTAAQPNVTSLGTLSSATITGNVTAGNVYANSGTVGASLLTGTLTTAAQPNVTSLGTLTSLTVTGNGTFGNVYANSGTIGASILKGEGGNISNVTAGNITGQVANALVAGTVYTAAQPNITSVGTLSSLAVSGNASAGNISVTGIFSGNGSGLSAIAGANVTGEVGFAAVANSVAAANISGQVANALVAGTVYTAAQPNITSVGTLTSLSVTGNASAGNISVTGIFSGNGSGLSAIAGANVTGEVAFAATANAVAGANVSGQVANALVAGTVYTAAQPNITSVGTLSSLSVTGNVAAGNLTTTGILSVTGTGVSSIAGNLDMTSNNIINLAAPVNSTDAATKQYVDDVAQGLNIHDSCAAATPDTLATITGGTITYNNGTAGVGATLVTTGTFNLIDGVNVQTAGTRILVKNEANAVHNGIYTYTNTTAITRAADFNSVPEVEAGDFTFVTGGTLYDNTGWVQTESPTAIGTAGNNISFTQFSGAGTYQAGTGLTLTGSTFSVNASQTQITSVGTLTGLNVNGNITAANITANTGVFTGNGSGLTALNASNISSGTLAQARLANATLTLGNTTLTLGGTTTTVAGLTSVTSTSFVGALTGAATSATTAGTVTTAAQPNITSTGTLTSLTVSGATSVTGNSALTVTNLTSGANTTLGYLTGNWTLTSGSRLQATYADLAEKYAGDATYDVGTVLVFGGDQEVTIANEHDSHRVAGVVSENAAYIMNSGIVADHPITLALTGRVPVKVHGPVAKGDLMVTGLNGHAVANNMARAGTILGKALQNFEGGSGVIEVVVGRV